MPKSLTVQVLLAIVLGVVLGCLVPSWAIQLKFLSDIFIRLVKMVIAPVVFLTIAQGIANMGDLKKVGTIGAKALLYFEVMTTIALAIGVAVAYVVRPGAGFDVQRAHGVDVSAYAVAAHGGDMQSMLMSIVPESFVGALASGNMLSVLLVAVLFGAVLARQGAPAAPLNAALHTLSQAFFGIINLVMRISPVAAFGAMAYTVGQFGAESLLSLGQLMLSVYLTMALFIFGVLGLVARLAKFRLGRLLRHIRAEILLVLGTSSSESVLPSIMVKLEQAGCAKSVVGLVIPTGYSFNLDGTSIYLSMATLFIAQAYGVVLSWEQLAMVLGVLMLTSKGAAGVTGSGFVTLAATLAALPNQHVPPEGIALVIGVDRFMSEARAITNLIGNSVATVTLAKLEGEFVDRGVL